MTERSTPDQLLPEVYEELRRIAHRVHRSSVSVAPTSLVHEAWARIAARPERYERNHFIALAARAMRQILVDLARERAALKRGGNLVRTTLVELGGASPDPVDLLALDAALLELQELNPRAVEVVQLRFIGGLSVEEAAEILGVSPRTVKGDWRVARAWLMTRLQA